MKLASAAGEAFPQRLKARLSASCGDTAEAVPPCVRVVGDGAHILAWYRGRPRSGITAVHGPFSNHRQASVCGCRVSGGRRKG